MYKVPFRQVYCHTFIDCLRSTFWCHVVTRIFPGAADLASDSLRDCYAERPDMMYEQYKHVWVGNEHAPKA